MGIERLEENPEINREYNQLETGTRSERGVHAVDSISTATFIHCSIQRPTKGVCYRFPR